MSFPARIKKSQIAIHRFDSWCERNGIVYAKSGYEDLLSNNGETFRKLIQQLDDNTARRIRYFPDREVVLNYVTLVEIKNAKTIEKNAYYNYINLHQIGFRVGIVVLNNILGFTPIDKLKFKIPDKNKIHLPIIDQYWLAPRLLNKFEYFLWKKKHPQASGTSFAYIDFLNTEWTVLE